VQRLPFQTSPFKLDSRQLQTSKLDSDRFDSKRRASTFAFRLPNSILIASIPNVALQPSPSDFQTGFVRLQTFKLDCEPFDFSLHLQAFNRSNSIPHSPLFFTLPCQLS
jgi:hypothetical protein